MTAASREYKLAAYPVQSGPQKGRREILEITEDDRRKVILIVANSDAMDVRDALARVYQDGREDNAADITVARNDVIGIVPDAGPRRTMLVSHVEQHIITLNDLPGDPS